MLKLCALLLAFIDALAAMEAGQEEVEFYGFYPINGVMTPYQRSMRDYLLSLPDRGGYLADKAVLKAREMVKEAVSMQFPDCVYEEIEREVAQKELSQNSLMKLENVLDFLYTKREEHTIDTDAVDYSITTYQHSIMDYSMTFTEYAWGDALSAWRALKVLNQRRNE